ncbi:hypothetical protein NQ318_004302 [Aromia moschata]|uniref:Uncharacterized protein n=1 Tax=Aromia moschata TaxID=1265417 RepID=A0AAV8YSJ5_9CUCU|nr:hypothetical protein NQ318_004302 [Aromia moschata]
MKELGYYSVRDGDTIIVQTYTLIDLVCNEQKTKKNLFGTVTNRTVEKDPPTVSLAVPASYNFVFCFVISLLGDQQVA